MTTKNLDIWRRQHNRDLDGCFGSSDGGYDKENGKHVRNWACDMCITGKECRTLTKHRFAMRRRS